MDCSTGPLSFLHVNVSGGEPLEVQDNVSGSPTLTVIVFDDIGSVTGAAVQKHERWLSDEVYKSIDSLLPLRYSQTKTAWGCKKGHCQVK